MAWQGTVWSCGYGCSMLTALTALPRYLIQAAKTLKAHADPYDVFVTQLKGYKQWTVCVPRPAIMNKVYKTRAPTQAERCELQLQTQVAPERCTFYTVSAVTRSMSTLFLPLLSHRVRVV